MFRFLIPLCAFVMSLGFISTVRADDTMIDNPTYTAWAKFKPGTLIKYSTTSTAMGNITSSQTTKTLKTVADDKVTIEIKSSMVVAGNTTDLPATTQEIPAKMKKPDTSAVQQDDVPKTENSTEDVEEAGKTYSCEKTVITSNQNGMTTTATTWTCQDVPGGLVKMMAESSGSMTATVKVDLTDIQAQQ